jgi:hypothetical protein
MHVLQRLLWELDGNLAFGEPTVDQFRNPHMLMRDFKDEVDLYYKGGQIVDFLIKWRPALGSDLPTMMVDLAKVDPQPYIKYDDGRPTWY